MARLGISEKIVFAYNPLPQGVTEAQLIKDADLTMLAPRVRSPFTFTWKYACQQDRETVICEPGKFIPLRVSESKHFLASFRQLGLVVVEDPADEIAVINESLKGLRIAFKRYKDYGSEAARELMRARGLQRDDMAEYRHDYWPYWINEASSKVVAAEIERLTKALAEAEEIAELEANDPEGD